MIELPLIERPGDSAPTPRPDVSPTAADLFRLLADATRRRIFLALLDGETCNCEMAGLLGLAQNLISHHVGQLRRAGLVRARRHETDQRWIYYSVDREVLGRVHRELGALLDPDRIGSRMAQCGPAATESS